MNARNLVSSRGLIALLAIPLTAYCADPSHRCASVSNDLQRLSCYDAAFGKPALVADAPVPAAAARIPVPAVAPAVAPVVAPAVAPAPAPAVVPVEARTAVTTSKRDEKAASKAARPASISSAVADLKRKRDGRFEATLQNGEVWTQVEPDSGFQIGVGDAITIRSAMLGSFLLATKSGITTRVKRTK